MSTTGKLTLYDDSTQAWGLIEADALMLRQSSRTPALTRS